MNYSDVIFLLSFLMLDCLFFRFSELYLRLLVYSFFVYEIISNMFGFEILEGVSFIPYAYCALGFPFHRMAETKRTSLGLYALRALIYPVICILIYAHNLPYWYILFSVISYISIIQTEVRLVQLLSQMSILMAFLYALFPFLFGGILVLILSVLALLIIFLSHRKTIDKYLMLNEVDCFLWLRLILYFNMVF